MVEAPKNSDFLRTFIGINTITGRQLVVPSDTCKVKIF